ncbi:MAG: hypothetical protein Unbinned80contig1000_16 [Prokaryotic dsDNA virus sp.]|nr:MAG: hypothetical protein Unbinned80contig1000_16 [Prokaryotic dsDNA virus sp.]
MPGTPEEYMSDSNTSKAAGMIDDAISQQKSGMDIIEMLEGSGLRVYASDESEKSPMGEEGMEESPMGEAPMGEMEEPPMLPDLAAPELKGGDEGGMRDMRIDAVRFALDKDKKNKEQDMKEFE